jgi:hypothetical protein
MFGSKLKTTTSLVMAGALLSGTALLGHRAMGLQQGPAAGRKLQPGARGDRAGEPAGAPPRGVGSPEIEAIGKTRIEVATKLRDATRALWREGQTTLVELLTVQKHYDDVVADVMVKTDADRLRYLAQRVSTLKEIEDGTRELYRRNRAPQRDLLTAELARLDAEYALAKAKAEARGDSR